MTASLRTWVYEAPAITGTASGVLQANTIGASDHLRHVRVSGSTSYVAYPTNVVGDDGVLVGVLATFPAAAPAVPSVANANTWKTGWWGRPVIDSDEVFPNLNNTVGGHRRLNWHVEFDYAPDGAGVAGAVFVGWQALYVDANHQLPIFNFSFSAWGVTI